MVTGVAMLLVGSGAMAAGTGNLPAGVQQRAHDLLSPLGVAVPGGAGGPDGRGSPSPSASPTVALGGKVTDPSGSAALVELCQAWQASKNPGSNAMTTEQLRDLIAQAGSKASITGFCTSLLATNHGQAASTKPTPATPTPSHPGNGHGKDNGQGHPSPSPHQ
jgi:hypothetical protein